MMKPCIGNMKIEPMPSRRKFNSCLVFGKSYVENNSLAIKELCSALGVKSEDEIVFFLPNEKDDSIIGATKR